MTASAGSYTFTAAGTNKKNLTSTWEAVTVFSLVSGDTTGLATIPMDGILQKVIVKLSDMAAAEGTTVVSLTDNGDNEIFTTAALPENLTYTYSVFEPLSKEVNILLAFTNPEAPATVTVTLRGMS